MAHRPRRGVTLLELIVVLVLLAFMVTVAGLAARPRARSTAVDALHAALASARRAAIDSGRAVTRTMIAHGMPHRVTALPDGSVVADTPLAVDRLSGTLPTTVRSASGPVPRGTEGPSAY